MKRVLNNKLYKNNKSTLISGILAFIFFTLTTKPNTGIKNRMPEKRYKNISISNNDGAYIKIQRKNKVFHLHHWLLLTTVYLPVLALRKGILKSRFLHGFFLGSIIQGLVYHDRFRIIETLENVIEDDKALTPAK